MKKFNKIIAIMLVVASFFTTIPTSVYAASSDDNLIQLYNEKQNKDVYVEKATNSFYINGKKINEEEFVDMVINSGIIIESPEHEFSIELHPGAENITTYRMQRI